MFFAYENPLEVRQVFLKLIQIFWTLNFDSFDQEMFALTIQHVNKTWREMRATAEDFPKVIDVTKEQITGALRASPIK